MADGTERTRKRTILATLQEGGDCREKLHSLPSFFFQGRLGMPSGHPSSLNE